MIFDVSQTLVDESVDACTLNNALNIAQLIALAVLIRWLRATP